MDVLPPRTFERFLYELVRATDVTRTPLADEKRLPIGS